MRILVFSAYFHPHKGGLENYVFEIYSRLIKKGFKVDILTNNTNNAPAEEKIDGMQIYRLPCWNILGGTYPIFRPSISFFKTWKKLWRNNYNIINTQTRFFLTSFLGLLFAKLKGVKLFHTEHGTCHSYLSNPLTSLINRLYDHTLGWLVIRFANQNIAISDASGKFAQHLGAKNYKVIYNGIDTKKIRRKKTDLKAKLGIPENFKIITFVGRLIEAKGVQDLIKVFKKIRKNYSVKLLIVGEGNYRPVLEKLSNNKDILFLGEKSLNEITEILSMTDVFVNPSYSEGLPSSVLEAGACSCAVIVTDVGGTKEIIDHNENGFLFKPKDIKILEQYLRKLLEDENLSNQFGFSLRKKIEEKFDWDIIVKKYDELLRKN